VVRAPRVIDAWEAIGGVGSSLRELLAADRLGELAEVEGDGEPLGEVELLPPIPDPEKIIGIGLNYAEHAREGRLEPPASQTFFAKFRNALRPDGATCLCRQRARRSTTRPRSRSSSAAVPRTSPRRRRSTTWPVTRSSTTSRRAICSSRRRSGCRARCSTAPPCGPAIVTPDEAGPHDALGVALDLNGERMQESSTADLIFSIPQLVSHLSTLMTLEPGDLVATGTPAGVGGAREPRVWLKPGDELVVSSPQLGRLVTRIG
jgi:2-keto-4-pentenoate hydratase/2-oxohepta-3-ene-1,7-dioic acid hydratase in catechol pathway